MTKLGQTCGFLPKVVAAPVAVPREAILSINESPSDSIDRNLAYTQLAMGTIEAIPVPPGDSVAADAQSRASLIALLGVAGPPMTAGAMLLLYKVAIALFIGLGPLFILCLVFVINGITGANAEGFTNQALQQGGVGLLMTVLLVSASAMAAIFFGGTLGSFYFQSAFSGGGTARQWPDGKPSPYASAGPANTTQASPGNSSASSALNRVGGAVRDANRFHPGTADVMGTRPSPVSNTEG